MSESKMKRKINDSLLETILIFNWVWDSSYTKKCGKQEYSAEETCTHS